jgi:hypothetical protein
MVYQTLSYGIMNYSPWTMLNFCGIVVAILKMATSINFSMSGHHYLPTYQILMILDNVEFLWHCGGIESYGKVEISYINVDNL